MHAPCGVAGGDQRSGRIDGGRPQVDLVAMPQSRTWSLCCSHERRLAAIGSLPDRYSMRAAARLLEEASWMSWALSCPWGPTSESERRSQ